MVYGRYDLLLPEHEEIYAFTRTLDDDRLLVILNFSGNSPVLNLPDAVSTTSAELVIGNYRVDPSQDFRQLTLRPYEARVYRLK